MRSYILLIITIFSFGTLFAQPLNQMTPEIVKKQAKESYDNGDYYTALERYEEIYEDNKDVEIAYLIADCYYKIRDYRRAERRYSTVIRKVERIKERKKRRPKKYTVPDYPDLRFRYAQVLKMNEEYDKAIEEFQTYINDEAEDPAMVRLARMEINGAEMAKEAKDVPGLTVENAGDEINSKFTDFSPAITADGQEMYFASFNRDDIITLDGEEGDYHAKIYSARKTKDEWVPGGPLDTRVNRENYHTGNVALSSDGNTMYFTRSLLESNELIESKIYYSRKVADGWSGANEIKGGANGDFLSKHPMPGELFGQDVLFFISDMPGGYGGFDVYYAPLKGEGEVGEAVNLGKVINSPADEATPFYLEGTLYFSSQGYPSFGGYDIFYSIWDGSSWSDPKNMGKGYNSSVDDLYFNTDEEGLNGFLVSNRPGGEYLKSRTCCDDIYFFMKEPIIADLKVLVFESIKKEPLMNATIDLLALEEEAMPVDSRTNQKGNDFGFELELEKAYSVIASAEGYFSDTLSFNTVGLDKSQTFNQEFVLVPIPKEPEFDTITVTINEPIRLNQIYYDFDDDKILPDAEEDLNTLLGLLNEYPDMVIELSSHTDSRGNDAYNQDLSQRRANSAKKWLTEKGIGVERIKAVGYGEAQILNQCKNGVECTEEEHRFNRRTEFKILEGPTSIQIKQTKIEKREEGDQ